MLNRDIHSVLYGHWSCQDLLTVLTAVFLFSGVAIAFLRKILNSSNMHINALNDWFPLVESINNCLTTTWNT